MMSKVQSTDGRILLQVQVLKTAHKKSGCTEKGLAGRSHSQTPLFPNTSLARLLLSTLHIQTGMSGMKPKGRYSYDATHKMQFIHKTARPAECEVDNNLTTKTQAEPYGLKTEATVDKTMKIL